MGCGGSKAADDGIPTIKNAVGEKGERKFGEAPRRTPTRDGVPKEQARENAKQYGRTEAERKPELNEEQKKNAEEYSKFYEEAIDKVDDPFKSKKKSADQIDKSMGKASAK